MDYYYPLFPRTLSANSIRYNNSIRIAGVPKGVK